MPVVKRLQQHFGVQRVCIVADRGMISDATMAEIESRGWFYILGVRMRRSKEARDEVLTRGGRYRTVQAKSDDLKAPSPLQVKEVRVSDEDDEGVQRRYIAYGVAGGRAEITKPSCPGGRACGGNRNETIMVPLMRSAHANHDYA